MTVHFLGTGSAHTSPDRTTTMLAFEAADTFFLVDCGGDAVHRLLMAGLVPADVEAVVLTHEHPDHISGFPLLIEKLWLAGRRTPIPVYGLPRTLDVARGVFSLFDTNGWEHVPTVEYHVIEATEDTAVFERGPFRVTSSPVFHPVPTVGLRVEAEGVTVAYSCDTAPHPVVARLARDAALLIHEATEHLPGVHSSAEEAAACAAEAGVGRLVLVHLPPVLPDLAEARAIFPETAWAADGDRIDV